MNMYNPYGMPTAPYNAFPAQRHEVIRVSGRNGAEAFQMAPNSSVLLLDETAPVVWLKTTDGAGYPTLASYDITPSLSQEQKEQSRFDVLEKRISNLEAILNDKSNPGSIRPEQRSKKREPDTAND